MFGCGPAKSTGRQIRIPGSGKLVGCEGSGNLKRIARSRTLAASGPGIASAHNARYVKLRGVGSTNNPEPEP